MSRFAESCVYIFCNGGPSVELIELLDNGKPVAYRVSVKERDAIGGFKDAESVDYTDRRDAEAAYHTARKVYV